MTSPAIELRGVCKRYREFSLQDIDLHLEAGEIVGFIGPNGAGKSTTIRILMGLVHQDRGQCRVLGHEMPAQQVEAKRDIGFVSDDMRLFRRGTLDWHMRFVASIYSGWDEAYAQALLERFELRPAQTVGQLSHGERVKAMLLLALARRPRLLVLDEPTTGLDPVARYDALGEFMDVIRDEGRTILFSSHNTRDVEQICDRVVFIDRGKVIESRDKESYLDRWRRVRLDLAPDVELPVVESAVDVKRSGRSAVVIVGAFDASVTERYRGAGASVQGVEPMTLEEIFVAQVRSARAGGKA